MKYIIALGFLSLTFSAHGASLNADQKRRLMLLTTIFENHFPNNTTPTFAYDYIENLEDGRGFTAGRVGFCTGTGDLVEVVEAYTKTKPKNPLSKHLPALRQLATTESDNTSSLPEFIKDWQACAKDKEFIKAQDDVTDRLYYNPAMKIADNLGIRLPFGRAILYDTIVMHGEGHDPDSIGAIVARATKAACAPTPTSQGPSQEGSRGTASIRGCTPKNGTDEKLWLRLFLAERKKVLLHPHNTETQAEWSKNAHRADILSDMLTSGSYDHLDKPMRIKNRYFKGVIP